MDLKTTCSLGLGNNRPLDLDDALSQQSIYGRYRLWRLDDNLTNARTVTQVDKHHTTSQPSNAVHPAGQPHPLSCVKREFATQHTIHLDLHI
jgi:hypothetical protein